jgi:hypothetical protein
MARRKKVWRARLWRSNPSGIVPTVMKLPKMSALKSERRKGTVILSGAVGLIDTGLVGMAVNYGLAGVELPEWQRDTGRIVSKVFFGTLMSYGVQKSTKNTTFAQAHQVGVYINTGLDVIGTVLKYAQRGDYKLTSGIVPPMTLKTVAGEMFGVGSIMNALGEAKIGKALTNGGIVVAQGDNGQLALAEAGTGNILLSGPADGMKSVIDAVKNISVSKKRKV